MPSKRPPLINGEIYHIVIRAVEGIELFRDKKDYSRMTSNLFEFNDEAPIGWQYRYRYLRNQNQSHGKISREFRKRETVVEILAFCLMPNHVHLLVRQIRDAGISKFMRKIGAGYSAYYNQKYKRAGHVFQGRHKLVHIENDKQLYTIFVYIHTNPVAILFPKWKEKGIKNARKTINFVENYRWSSYPDYLGRKNFPSLTNREFLIETMGGVKGCKESVDGWLQFKKELADFGKIAME